MRHEALAAWLAGREPAPPVRLAESLHAALMAVEWGSPRDGAVADGAAGVGGGAVGSGGAGANAVDPMPELLVRESAAIVRRLLATGGTDRQSALALLAADALATYAFEAAADEPARLEARCRAAMHRLSEVVDVP